MKNYGHAILLEFQHVCFLMGPSHKTICIAFTCSFFGEETKHFEIKLSLNVLSTQDGANKFESFGHPDAFLHSLKILIGEFSKTIMGSNLIHLT